jgi:hypothetical protein
MSRIERFLELVRVAESRHQREIVMTLSEARDLHSELTRLLLALHAAHENADQKQITQILDINGGDF